MFGQDEDDRPPTDGEQFDAVGRFEEPGEPDADEPGDPAESAELAESAATTPDSEDVHPRIKVHFWLLVGVFNVAFLAVGIGATLALLGEYQTLGRQILLAGLVLFAYGVYRYRHAKAAVENIVEEGEGTADGPETDQG